MASDNQFTALGPTEIGFQTNGTNIRLGASIAGSEIGVLGHCDDGFGVEGTGHAAGVHGKGLARPGILGTGVGVFGESSDQPGVRGASVVQDGVVGSTNSAGRSGVFGFNTQTAGDTFGVSGNANSPDGAGVNGFSDKGVGVRGASGVQDGVVGSTNIAGRSGVFGFSTQTAGATFGVSGSCDSPDGAGIHGISDQGYGGHFRGGRAPLRLVPANTAGRPTTGNHQRGELFVGLNGNLFYCRDSGTPGNWFQVQLTPA